MVDEEEHIVRRRQRTFVGTERIATHDNARAFAERLIEKVSAAAASGAEIDGEDVDP